MPLQTKEKQVAYQKVWMKSRRTKFIGGKPCSRCGTLENTEIHHRDPSAKESHRIWSWSETRIREELAKCDILCRNCHMEHHRAEALAARKHGTMTMYKNAKCRCADCRAVNANYVREVRARNGR